jgi:cellulose synthase/poly-beta-1,6-N-acetylglucosamine synthase-like glycosyltransferase
VDPAAVSIIIACRDEAAIVARKLENCLALRRPGPVEILVVDDSSTDGTVAAAHGYLAARGPLPPDTAVRLLTNHGQPGKNGALLTALAVAAGRLLLITDADVLLDPDALERAHRRFGADASLGALCLTPRISSERRTTLAAYANGYERFNRRLKMLQSRLDSVPILHGQAMFIRAAANVAPHPALPADDVDFAFQVRRRGLRVRYADDLPFYEALPPGGRHVFRQKVRRAKAVMRTLWHHREVAFNPRYGAFGALCVPIDVFLYFALAPLALAGGAAATTVLIARFGLAGAGATLGAAALTLATPARQAVLYLTLLAAAQAELLREQGPKIRWKTPRLPGEPIPTRRVE